MKKLFCFLGTGRYLETMYQNADYVMASKFTQEYLVSYYATIKQDPFGEIVVFATEESKAKNGQDFEEILGEMPIKWVYYDESISEKPWLLFEKIDSNVASGDSIIFDVTHGFRSIPLISLVSSELALLFNDNMNIEAVYYGNFKGEGVLSPFVDLTSILWNYRNGAMRSVPSNRPGIPRCSSIWMPSKRKITWKCKNWRIIRFRMIC